MDIKIKRVGPGVYDVIGMSKDTTIEKRYGEWRILDDTESFSPMGFDTMRDAVKWLMSHLKRKGHI